MSELERIASERNVLVYLLIFWQSAMTYARHDSVLTGIFLKSHGLLLYDCKHFIFFYNYFKPVTLFYHKSGRSLVEY